MQVLQVRVERARFLVRRKGEPGGGMGMKMPGSGKRFDIWGFGVFAFSHFRIFCILRIFLIFLGSAKKKHLESLCTRDFLFLRLPGNWGVFRFFSFFCSPDSGIFCHFRISPFLVASSRRSAWKMNFPVSTLANRQDSRNANIPDSVFSLNSIYHASHTHTHTRCIHLSHLPL